MIEIPELNPATYERKPRNGPGDSTGDSLSHLENIYRSGNAEMLNQSYSVSDQMEKLRLADNNEASIGAEGAQDNFESIVPYIVNQKVGAEKNGSGLEERQNGIQSDHLRRTNFDGKVNLELSQEHVQGLDSSFDIKPQILEINTAEKVYASPFRGTDINMHQNLSNKTSNAYSSQPFKLQAAPKITRKSERDTPAEYYDKSAFIHTGRMSSDFNISSEVASPLSHFTRNDFIKPSPQLPPPLSTLDPHTKVLEKPDPSSVRRHLADNMKTPAEYTLHIIFTQFVRHAEKLLNQFLNCPLDEEPSPIKILGKGVDPNFDKVIESLGYIARKKPKPVIDSVMYWRKSKSEVASMAVAEVEKLIVSAKVNDSTLPNKNLPPKPVVNKSSSTVGKAKRSLSLIRSKSISKRINHSRNLSTPIAFDQQKAYSNDNSNEYNSETHKFQDFYESQLSQARETAIQADRKSLALIYILCRVLMEVVRQTPSDIIGDDLGDKLEEIIFMQLKTTEPSSIRHSLVRAANWTLFAKILGYMSEKRFLNVSDRFIASLEKVPPLLNHEEESKIQLLVYGMKYLKLTNYPLEVFEESADFLLSLAKFFTKTKSECILYSYCEIVSSLVLPLANILTAETNYPTWVEAVNKIYTKGQELIEHANRLNHPDKIASFPMVSDSSDSNGALSCSLWSRSLNLVTAALSVSSKELFADSWFSVVEKNIYKLRPKTDSNEKTAFLLCTTRLVWVYLYRLNDTLNNTIKRLDSLFNLLFFNSSVSGKKQQWLVFDNSLIATLIQLIRIVGYQHLNYVLESVLLKLLNSAFNEHTQEIISAEKLILTLRSYSAIVQDQEIGRKPEFPLLIREEEETNDLKLSRKKIMLELSFLAKNSSNMHFHEEIRRIFSILIETLDSEYGAHIWPGDSTTKVSSGHLNYKHSTFSALGFGIDFSDGISKSLSLGLFACLIRAAPWALISLPGENTSNSGTLYKNVLRILIRNSVHSNPKVATFSKDSLKMLACRKNPTNLIAVFAKLAFKFTDKTTSNYEANYFHSSECFKLLELYVELLSCWLEQLSDLGKKEEDYSNPLNQADEQMNKDVLNEMYQIKYKDVMNDHGANANRAKVIDDLEWKSILTSIEEIEGNGLFFVCSQDSLTRTLGITILRLVDKFDQIIYTLTNETSENDKNSDNFKTLTSHSRSNSKFAADVGTRLIHILEDTDFLELIKPYRKELSLPERGRVSKLKNRKGLLVKLATSDYGIDSTIWFRLYPRILDIFFEKCPMAVAMCRSIVCTRIVQMYELIFSFSETSKNLSSTLFSRSETSVATEVLVNQWRLYLIFACCSLTSTNEQKMTFHSQPTHGRKKSMQMFLQHQKITSAKSVIRMVLPFLKSDQLIVSNSVVAGISCLNINIFRTFLENIPPTVTDWEIDSKRRDPYEDKLRIEIIHILFNITSRFKQNSVIYEDDWIIANLVSMIKNVKTFLSVTSNQTNFDFQRLRRYFSGFLENVFLGLQDEKGLDKWLPFEARIGCFNFLKEWCGYGDAMPLADERYEVMSKKIKQKPDSALKMAILEVEKKALQFASLSTMSALCAGPIQQKIELVDKVAVMSFDIMDLMNWIHTLFCDENEKINEIGQVALKNILKLNVENAEIYDKVYLECYISQPSSKVSQSYFLVFSETIMKYYNLLEVPHDLFCLATLLTGSGVTAIRRSAMDLLKFLLDKFSSPSTILSSMECTCSDIPKAYNKILFEISSKLAASHPENSLEWVSYCCMFYNSVDNFLRKNLTTIMIPWLQNIILAYDQSSTEAEEASKDGVRVLNTGTSMILENLCEITIKYSFSYQSEVEALWIALSKVANNVDILMDYLLNLCIEQRNTALVNYARQIVDSTAFGSSLEQYIIKRLLDNLQPKAMVPQQNAISELRAKDSSQFVYVADLIESLPREKEFTFSLGQLSLIFLVDLLATNKDMAIAKLSLLFHVSFLLLDHYVQVVQELAINMLSNLVHCIAADNVQAQEIVDSLRRKDHTRYMWVYDDLNNDKKGARTPKNMDLLTRKILDLFSTIAPNLQEDWSRLSLYWATICAVRHIACRSFQLFRSLFSFLDQGMLKDMLHRLSNTISDDTIDIQGFSMQILMTLNATTAELSSAKLIDFPQLFWSSVACMSTVNEQEFIEVLSTMSKFVSKIDLDAPDTVSCLISTFPPKWEGKFEGLQLVILPGLKSANAWESSIKILDKFNKLKDSEIIGSGDLRLLMAVLSNLPRYLHALDQKNISGDIEDSALVISRMAENCNKASLSRILVSLSKNRFRSKKDFLVQTISTINDCFFPQYEAQALVFLLGLLSNKMSFVKLETMSMLKHVFPLVDLQRDEFIGVGADLISPLLRLLLTDYAEPALEVLDEVTVIPGSQLDKDVLRMSLGSVAMKKEYENTATLFGIPEESGWSVTMPLVTAASTRNNVHAVFLTCAQTAFVDEDTDTNNGKNIQFHAEEYHIPVAEYADTISDNVDEPDASLSHMWAALDDFDSFFTKEADHGTGGKPTAPLNFHSHTLSTDTKYSNQADLVSTMDSAPLVYDKKASVIVNESLARTQSNTSFKNNLSDSIGSPIRGYQTSSPFAKRSYIPFRNSKFGIRHKHDSSNFNHTSSPKFDREGSGSPLRTPIMPSSTVSPKNAESFSLNHRDLDATINNLNSNDGSTSSKKKKKSNKSISTPPSGSTEQHHNHNHSHNHNWLLHRRNSATNTASTQNVSPPNSGYSGIISNQKLREKKRASNKS